MKYFQNMDVSKVNVNKMCWKTVKPSFIQMQDCKHNYFDRKGILL